ncbi:hypothetical protein [Hominifimenecus sp. rT4P-3]|uniref:hypothetical protein n=1 Tax=Hominifimenecus sp. rT4P-3 TaxID=3242979 RepID=UPI003DA259FA
MMEQKNQTRYGSFLVIPLKYDKDSLERTRLEQIGDYRPLHTMDLNENIKAMFDRRNEAAIGACYTVGCSHLVAGLCDASESMRSQTFQVSEGGNAYDFELTDSYLYIFHTQVAFLCLSLSFLQMEALMAICNPGYAYSNAKFSWIDKAGMEHPFSMESWLSDFCASLGLRKFFDGDSSFLLDAYAYIFALVPKRFDTLDEMQRITFHLHKMMPLDTPIEDMSEEDIRYVYGVKNQSLHTYRWGCCVASQTISYVVADEAMDFEAEKEAQANDGLPVVLLSLYEKYTCLRFTELITRLDKGESRSLKALKNVMLQFQAFGTVTPANLSRWHNVKQIYAYLLEVNDISVAIQDISNKLNILTEHQMEIERTRSETVINIITVFGIISILASVLSIVQILSGGDVLIWISTVLTTAALTLIMAVAVRNRRK